MTKQASSDAAQAASDKAAQAKNGPGSLLQQTGDALGKAYQSPGDRHPQAVEICILWEVPFCEL